MWSETWFVHYLCDSFIVCEGFNVYRSDRTGHAESFAIYVNVKLKCKVVLKQPSDITIEYIPINPMEEPF